MNARLVHLRVKIRSLASEARIIRHEEKRSAKRHRARHGDADGKMRQEHSYNPILNGLHSHRTVDVRRCTRHNLLAYGFLRGMAYSRMEARCSEAPDFDEVKQHAKKFCPDRTWRQPWPDEWEQRWKAWLIDAKAHIEGMQQQAA